MRTEAIRGVVFPETVFLVTESSGLPTFTQQVTAPAREPDGSRAQSCPHRAGGCVGSALHPNPTDGGPMLQAASRQHGGKHAREMTVLPWELGGTGLAKMRGESFLPA